MKNNLKKIDRLFHDNLDHLADQPPAHIWKGIENALDDMPVNTGDQTGSGKRYLLLAALFLATATAGILFRNQQLVSISPIVAVNEPVIPIASPAPLHPEQTNRTVSIITPAAQVSLPVVDALTEVAMADHTALPVSEETIPVYENRSIAATIPFTSPVSTVSAPVSVLDINEHLLPATLIVTTSNTQKTVQTRRPGRFSITAFFAPDITTRNLAKGGGSSQDEEEAEIARTEKNSAFDYTIGARIEYSLNKHFSVQTGISFSRNAIEISPKTIFARYDVDGTVKYRFNLSSGYTFFKPQKASAVPLAVGDSTQSLASTSLLHYVNIPLALRYNYAVGRRLNLSAQAGITARFITKQSIAAVYATANGNDEKNTSNQITGLKTSYFNGVVGLGADYSLNAHLAITVFPSFNFATTSININAPVKAYPNTLSFAAGLRIKL